MSRSSPSTTSGLSVEDLMSSGNITAGRRFANRFKAFRKRSKAKPAACWGRRRSSSATPDAPCRIASHCRASSNVAAGSESPAASNPAPPMGASWSSRECSRPSTAFRTLTPWAVTSLPIPSPGRTAIFMRTDGLPALLARYRYCGLFVVALAHAALGENGALGDPLEGFLEHVARVRLEDDAFARSPAAGVHLVVEPRGKLLLVIVRVELGPQIDIALRAAQCLEKLAHVLRLGIARDQRRHHEGAVDDLPESELFQEVIRTTEQRCRRSFPVDQLLHAMEQQPFGEGQVDLLGLEVLFQSLDGRIVAAGLKSHRDRNAGQIGGSLDRRIRRHENACRRNRVSIAIQLAVPVGGGDVHRPVAGATDVAGAPLLKSLISAELVAQVVLLAFLRVQLVAELVIEAFGGEITLLFGDPFLQAHVRGNNKLGHKS